MLNYWYSWFLILFVHVINSKLFNYLILFVLMQYIGTVTSVQVLVFSDFGISSKESDESISGFSYKFKHDMWFWYHNFIKIKIWQFRTKILIRYICSFNSCNVLVTIQSLKVLQKKKIYICFCIFQHFKLFSYSFLLTVRKPFIQIWKFTKWRITF